MSHDQSLLVNRRIWSLGIDISLATANLVALSRKWLKIITCSKVQI